MLLSAGDAGELRMDAAMLRSVDYFLEVFGWMLLSAGELWMDAAIRWGGALDGSCYPLGGFGWMLLLPGGLWVDEVIC